MTGALVADLGVTPEVWLILSLLGCLTLYFKFSRVWSVRNLDLLLLFAPAPGLMMLVGAGSRATHELLAFGLLFLGSGLWFVRCLVDLGLTRRPLLEPNLNVAGLTCLAIGMLGLLLTETIQLPVPEGAARNPADPSARVDPSNEEPLDRSGAVKHVLDIAPLPSVLKPKPPQVILARVLASIAHFGLVAGLIAVGFWHFDRTTTGLAMATCYLISPYTRIALVDCGQILPAALIVGAVAFYNRPALAGAFIGLASGWMPACLGLVSLWTGFYRGRGGFRFIGVAALVLLTCGLLGWAVPDLAVWSRALGARSLAEVGLLPGVESPRAGSFWRGIDVAYRFPVLIAYLCLVIITSIWPMEKSLSELICLSAALLVASQFWYLDEGGTLVLLYLPLVILMMFRPTLAQKRPILGTFRTRAQRESASPAR